MAFPLRRALKIGAGALVTVMAAGYLYLAFVYHSLNIFTPPERITSLGRTYILSGSPHLSADELSQQREQRSPNFTERHTFERVGALPPNHSIYQWQGDANRGRATTSAYLQWGDQYVIYGISGAP